MKYATRRAGFTLLELLIAIGLTSVLMVALFAAMDIYFKLQLDGHEEITRHQISRTLLRQMTRDIQSVVFVKKQTVDEDDAPTTGATGNTGGTASTGGTGSTGSTSSTGGTGSTSGNSSTGGTGLTGGASSTGSTSSTGGTGATSGTGTTASTADGDTTAAMLTYTSGLVGSATDLLLYVSRPDRTLSYVDAQSLTSTSERTGDLMIVRYLVADTGAGGLSATIAKQFAGTENGPIGLVRITGDLYGMSTALEAGEEEDFSLVERIDAKEVSQVTFSYFDGVNWQETWDSGTQNGLPAAIEIILTLRNTESGGGFSSDEPDAYALGETKHRMVVALPLAEPFIAETAL